MEGLPILGYQVSIGKLLLSLSLATLLGSCSLSQFKSSLGSGKGKLKHKNPAYSKSLNTTPQSWTKAPGDWTFDPIEFKTPEESYSQSAKRVRAQLIKCLDKNFGSQPLTPYDIEPQTKVVKKMDQDEHLFWYPQTPVESSQNKPILLIHQISFGSASSMNKWSIKDYSSSEDFFAEWIFTLWDPIKNQYIQYGKDYIQIPSQPTQTLLCRAIESFKKKNDWK